MDLLQAYQLAARLHCNQLDKAGRPYIEHLTRVLLRVQARGGDLGKQVAALLHDAIEDGKASAEQLMWVGVPAETISTIKILTKRKGQTYEDYLAVVKGNPEALLIKLADLDDNKDPARLAALPEVVAQRLRTKYERAAMFLAA